MVTMTMTRDEKLSILSQFESRQSPTYYWNSIDGQERLEERCISLSDIQHEKPSTTTMLMFYEVPYCAFSHYSGCDVERSNFRIVKKEYFEKCNELVEYYGDHGTTGLFIRDSMILDCVHDSDDDCPSCNLFNVIKKLADYPAIDDEDAGRVEYELRDEAWESDGRKDFIAALHAEYPQLENLIDSLTKEQVDALYRELEGGGNPLHQVETGGIVYFDFSILKKQEISLLSPAQADIDEAQEKAKLSSTQCPSCASGKLDYQAIRQAYVCTHCQTQIDVKA